MTGLINFVQAINAVNSNILAFLALCLGVFLALHNPALGDTLIVGSFALLRGAGTQDKGGV